MILTRKLISLFGMLLTASVTKCNLWDNLYSNQIANQALTTFLGQSVDTQIQGDPKEQNYVSRFDIQITLK